MTCGFVVFESLLIFSDSFEWATRKKLVKVRTYSSYAPKPELSRKQNIHFVHEPSGHNEHNRQFLGA